MKRIIVLFVFCNLSVSANAQLVSEDDYTRFAHTILDVIQHQDIATYQTLYFNESEFEIWKDHYMSKQLNPYTYYKRGLDTYKGNYDDYIRKRTPDYTSYINMLNESFNKLQEVLQRETNIAWSSIQLKSIIKGEDDEVVVDFKSNNQYFSMKFGVKITENILRLSSSGYERFDHIGTQAEYEKYLERMTRYVDRCTENNCPKDIDCRLIML